jgi:hypothetical protein
VNAVSEFIVMYWPQLLMGLIVLLTINLVRWGGTLSYGTGTSLKTYGCVDYQSMTTSESPKINPAEETHRALLAWTENLRTVDDPEQQLFELWLDNDTNRARALMKAYALGYRAAHLERGKP